VEDENTSSRARVARKGAHRKCARCAKVVSRRTLVCRRCGKRQRIDPRATIMACAGLFLIAVFAAATAGARLPIPRFGRQPAAQTAASVTAPPAPSAPSVATMTATELFSMYNLDPSRADAMFKNRPVAVSGRVTEVRRDFRGDFLLRLATDQPFDTVRATVTNRNGLTTVPAVGQTVALNCTGHGALIGSPILAACAPI
jgi:hypothetical protein